MVFAQRPYYVTCTDVNILKVGAAETERRTDEQMLFDDEAKAERITPRDFSISGCHVTYLSICQQQMRGGCRTHTHIHTYTHTTHTHTHTGSIHTPANTSQSRNSNLLVSLFAWMKTMKNLSESWADVKWTTCLNFFQLCENEAKISKNLSAATLCRRRHGRSCSIEVLPVKWTQTWAQGFSPVSRVHDGSVAQIFWNFKLTLLLKTSSGFMLTKCWIANSDNTFSPR